MELTKQQRHIAYIIMLEESQRPGEFYYNDLDEVKSSNRFGFCGMIRMIFDESFQDSDMYFVFPEIYKKRPAMAGAYWFGTNAEGWLERIKLLKQCIEETY